MAIDPVGIAVAKNHPSIVDPKSSHKAPVATARDAPPALQGDDQVTEQWWL